jgi:SRSO17 transposase
MEVVRPRLDAFAARMLGGLGRADQRAKGGLYLRGLAARLGRGLSAAQQFVSSSTWDYGEVRRPIAEWADERLAPEAYVVDDTGFAKDGTGSPGVARMYSGTLGKVRNCRVGVSVHAVTDWASAAVDWRLFRPASWDDALAGDGSAAEEAPRRPASCKIPCEPGAGRSGGWPRTCSTRSPALTSTTPA